MTPEIAAREKKAYTIATALRPILDAGCITANDIRTRDTEEFWRLVIQAAKVLPPSKPGKGIYHWISAETREMVLNLLEAK